MIFTLSRTSVKYVIQLTFGGVGGLLVPPLVEAHGHLVQLLAELPCGVLFELHPGVPELDVRVETVWLQVPADGGLEVGQHVRVGVEQALQLVRPRLPLCPHREGGKTGSLVGARPVGARGRGGGGARPAGVRGRREVGGGTAVTVFSKGPEPRIPKHCLTIRVGGGPAEAVFFNGPEVRVTRGCLRIMTHPSV